MKQHPPRWGNLVFHADHDFIAFGVLFVNGLFVESFYHGVQSIEKYLKALALTIYDPSEVKTNEEWVSWLRNFSHDLEKLGNYCGQTYPYYIQKQTNSTLKRLSEFDQATRYPWVERSLGNGFSGADLPIFFAIIKNLRNNLPIKEDDYPLGIAVRGHHQFHPNVKIDNYFSKLLINTAKKIRTIFPGINDLVRK